MAARATVLIVEDDEALRRMYQQTLMIAGFAVRAASNGRSALLQIDVERPDLVVLDLFLPGINGLEILLDLASQGVTSSIPIVVVTGSSMNLDQVDVACVLRKPIAADDLVLAVQRCLGSAAVPNA